MLPPDILDEAVGRYNDTTTLRFTSDIAIPAGAVLRSPMALFRGTLSVGGTVEGAITVVEDLTLDGFDTHSNQRDAHTALLTELSGAVHAFMKDIAHQGQAERVMVMTFSEFSSLLQASRARIGIASRRPS